MHAFTCACIFVMYTQSIVVHFAYNLNATNAFNISFDLFERCDNSKEKITCAVNERATVFNKSKEWIYWIKHTHKNETLSNNSKRLPIFTSSYRKHNLSWLCKRRYFFTRFTQPQKKKWTNQTANGKCGTKFRKDYTSTLIYEQRFFTLIPQIDFVFVVRFFLLVALFGFYQILKHFCILS